MNFVFGVEPNIEMRAASENGLKACPRFVHAAGRVEAKKLDQSA